MNTRKELTETQQRIYDTFKKILEEEGFQALGVNRIAEVAGVGKPLIYRYFNGLEGLIQLWAEDMDYWRGLTRLELEKLDELTKKNNINLMITRLIFSTRVVRRNPFLREIMRWKLIESNPLTDTVSSIREHSLEELSQYIPKSVTSNIDPQIITLLLSNSLLFTVLQEDIKAQWNNLDLKSKDGWDKVESHLSFIYEAIEEKLLRE